MARIGTGTVQDVFRSYFALLTLLAESCFNQTINFLTLFVVFIFNKTPSHLVLFTQTYAYMHTYAYASTYTYTLHGPGRPAARPHGHGSQLQGTVSNAAGQPIGPRKGIEVREFIDFYCSLLIFIKIT